MSKRKYNETYLKVGGTARNRGTDAAVYDVHEDPLQFEDGAKVSPVTSQDVIISEKRSRWGLLWATRGEYKIATTPTDGKIVPRGFLGNTVSEDLTIPAAKILEQNVIREEEVRKIGEFQTTLLVLGLQRCRLMFPAR